MKKGKLLNQHISNLVAKMGHTEKLIIADCGLPIASDTNKIDIALTKNIPTFMNTLETVLTELEVESAILAEEIKTVSPDLHAEVLKVLGNISISYVSHEEFKNQIESVKGCIRTGECTPYANIILVSGVTF